MCSSQARELTAYTRHQAARHGPLIIHVCWQRVCLNSTLNTRERRISQSRANRKPSMCVWTTLYHVILLQSTSITAMLLLLRKTEQYLEMKYLKVAMASWKKKEKMINSVFCSKSNFLPNTVLAVRMLWSVCVSRACLSWIVKIMLVNRLDGDCMLQCQWLTQHLPMRLSSCHGILLC